MESSATQQHVDSAVGQGHSGKLEADLLNVRSVSVVAALCT